MARKTRSDITIGSLEKKLRLDSGAIRNPDGSDARSDKQLGTLQNEFAKAKAPVKRKPATVVKKKLATAPAKHKPATAKTPDQAKAAHRVIKANPKATTRMVKRVSAAVKKTIKK